jgi:Amt family ammonium transporter
MKFSAMLLFSVLWLFIVYVPLAHMVWGKGGLLNAFSGGRIPCFDFAGGTVVHVSSGVSALVCALYLGKRKGFGSDQMKPHSLVLSVIGACLLWVGWFGFNAGSALAASPLAARAFVATRLAPRSAPRPPRRSDGCWSNGFTMESPACWAPSPGPLPDWWRSRRPPASSSRFQPC